MASVAADKEDVAIEIRLDEPDGRRIGLLRIAPTGGMDEYKEESCEIRDASGIHDLIFLFRGKSAKNLLHWDWRRFDRR